MFWRILPGAVRYRDEIPLPGRIMFKKITVAYNGSPEARRALAQAIPLAKALGTELCAITVVEALPSYTSYAAAADSTLALTLIEDQQEHWVLLRAQAHEAARSEGVELKTCLLEGDACEAIVRFLLDNKADLVVIGLHRHTS